MQIADKFIQAKQQVEAAKIVLEQARQLLLDFAADQEITTIRGHDAKVKVSHTTRTKIPTRTKHPDALALMETTVRSSGKWEQVSALNDKKLRDALQTDLFDQGTKAQLQSLLVTSTETRVGVARLSPREREDD